MSKAAISSIVAIILGYLGSAFGAEIMNWPQLGPILAIVVMGAAIIPVCQTDKAPSGSKEYALLPYRE